MPHVEEAELPGLGKKYVLTTHADDKAVIIIHHDGKREFYVLDRDEDEVKASLSLYDHEARQLGAVMAGVYFKPRAVESLEVVLEGLRIEWYKLEPGSPIAGKTIAELQVRQKTGVSVIAVIREPESVPNPPADLVFQPGDTVVVLGKAEGISAFHRLVCG